MDHNFILRPNAIPVYSFLSFIKARQLENKTFQQKKILDCGAGGMTPPLGLFYLHGFETWGIDISEDQLQKASCFAEQNGMALNLHKGDMRQIPFEDDTFDYVYEHYAMCHLSKKDTALAVREMFRVLKTGGYCFLGVISMDSWPKSMFGREENTGEFFGEENGEMLTLHSAFSDQEAEALVAEWEIVSHEKRVNYLREDAQVVSLDSWMKHYQENQNRYSEEEWRSKYAHRLQEFKYVHTYYYLRKP